METKLPEYVVAYVCENSIKELNDIHVLVGSAYEMILNLNQIFILATSFHCKTFTSMDELCAYVIGDFNYYNNMKISITIIDTIHKKVFTNATKAPIIDSIVFNLNADIEDGNYEYIRTSTPIGPKAEVRMLESALDSTRTLIRDLLQNNNISDSECRKQCLELFDIMEGANAPTIPGQEE